MHCVHSTLRREMFLVVVQKQQTTGKIIINQSTNVRVYSHRGAHTTILLLIITKQIHLVGERFKLKIHQNTTNYSYFVDVLVSSSPRVKNLKN